MPQQLLEQVTLAEAIAAGSAPSGRMTIQVITPGQGSSGYYPAAVCESAAGLVRAGTPMYLDHPTEADAFARPERSVRDLAAVFTESGRWDSERQAVIAEAQVFGPFREVLSEMAPYIGVSVRGDGQIAEGDVGGGRRGRVVESISSISSVDFVTTAGRGGKVLSLLESARISEAANVGQHLESRLHQHFTHMADNMAADGRLTRPERITLSGAIGDALDSFHTRVTADAPHLFHRDPMHPAPADASVAEAATNDTRDALDTAIKDTYGAEKTWVGVRDFDPSTSTVWFNQSTPDSDALFALAYTADANGGVKLDGQPTEVRAVTTYVPVNPAGPTTTQESQEDTMPQIEESELAQLREASGRVTALEERATTAETERDQARRERDASRAQEGARTRARARVTEANATLPAATVDRVVEAATRTVPLTEAGALDEAALDTAVDTARTSEETYLAGLAESAGVGRITNNGVTTPLNEGDVTREHTSAAIAEAFGHKPATTKTSQEG